MKKVLFIQLLLISCSFGLLDAQTLNFYNSGYEIEDLILTRRADTTGIHHGNSGNNVTWNFSGLIINSEIITQTCVDPSATPYAASFPGTDVAVSDNAGTFYFYKCDTIECTFIGMADTANIMIYSDPMVYFKYPITYGSTFSDSFISEYMSMITKGEQIVEADGKGTLILAGNTFNNVLRLKTTNYSGMSNPYFSMTMDMISYNWYDCIHKAPLLTINYLTYITSTGDSIKGKAVIVSNDIITSLKKNYIDFNVEIYPNPAKGKAEIQFSISNKSIPVLIELADMSGKIVLKRDIKNPVQGYNIQQLDISGLQAGVYFTIIKQGNVQVQKKLMVF